MKNLFYWISILSLMVSCEGKLSDKQRKEMLEARKEQEIKILTDAEITEAALSYGRTILAAVIKARNNPLKTDSIARATNSTIRWLEPGSENASLIESQLIEAYLVGAATGGAQENIQRSGADSLIYSRPELQEMPDGAIYVKGMWSIRLPNKQVILSIEN